MLVHLRSTPRSTVGEREGARHDLSIHGACPSIRFIVIAQRDDISCPRLARASSVRPRDEDLTIANQSSIIYSLLTIHRDVPRPANSSRWPELKSCSSCCWRTARGKSSGASRWRLFARIVQCQRRSVALDLAAQDRPRFPARQSALQSRSDGEVCRRFCKVTLKRLLY